MNAGNTLGYDFAKTFNREREVLSEGFPLHVLASVFAAFLSTTFSIPADYVMTRFQTARQLPGKTPYTSIISCVVDIARTEGLSAFFRGWVPLFTRVAPVYVCYLPLYEQFRLALGLGYFQ